MAQGVFLQKLGIRERAEILMKGVDGSLRDEICSALARLTGAKEMGTLFKVMAIGESKMPPPPGFESV